MRDLIDEPRTVQVLPGVTVPALERLPFGDADRNEQWKTLQPAAVDPRHRVDDGRRARRRKTKLLTFRFADEMLPPMYGFPTREASASRTPAQQRVTVGPERAIRTAPLP